MVVIIFSFVVIFVVTLFPFNFDFYQHNSFLDIIDSFYHPSSLKDFVANIILFIPFGWGVSNFLSKNNYRIKAVITIIVLTSFSLSLTVEILQSFLSSRASTIADLISNTIGGIIGFGIFYFSNHNVFTKISLIKKKINRKIIIILLIIYSVTYFFISLALKHSVNLSNWDSSYSLILGNEITEDRPWKGIINDLCIFDKALLFEELKSDNLCYSLESSLVTFYQFTGHKKYQDLSGVLPQLNSNNASVNGFKNVGIELDARQWLKTKKPATSLIERLKKSSQFTLITTLKTGDFEQVGPARIISISKDHFHRNLTVGQLGKNLIIRLRTPLTGNNGKRPEFFIRNAFIDNNFHRFFIIFEPSQLIIYIDNFDKKYSFHFSKETNFWILVSNFFDGRLDLEKFYFSPYMVKYYMIFGTPLILLLAILGYTTISRTHKRVNMKN